MNLGPEKRSLWKPLHWGAFIIYDLSTNSSIVKRLLPNCSFFPAGLASSQGKPKLGGKIAYLSLAHVLDSARNWNWALQLGDSLMKQSVKIVPSPHYYTCLSTGFKNSDTHYHTNRYFSQHFQTDFYFCPLKKLVLLPCSELDPVYSRSGQTWILPASDTS